MISILEDIKGIIPSKYNIVLCDIPPTGDCLVLNESNGLRVGSDLNTDTNKTISKSIQFYLRVKPKSNTYSDCIDDLYSYYNLIESFTNKSLGNKFIIMTTDDVITYLGKDKDSNMVFSLNFNIYYYIK